MITRRLIITAHEDYGLPTSIDDDIILALIQLTKQQNNFGRPDVTFTRRRVVQLLGWTDKGRNYDRIVLSLDRWASTYLRYENAWWDNEGRRSASGGFHIIDSFKIRDGRTGNGQGELFRSQIVWGNEFFKSCQAGYLKSLDYDLYIRLKYHPSKRMLRFLDKRFYHKLQLSLRTPRLRRRARGLKPHLSRRREAQGEAPARDRGAGRDRLPRTHSPRGTLSEGWAELENPGHKEAELLCSAPEAGRCRSPPKR